MPQLFGVECSPDVYEANKHMLAQPKEENTPARKDLDAELRKQFALQFEAQWRLLNGPELEPEFRFCPDRQWHSDYLVIGTKWLIELEGGIHSGGRHVRPAGFIEDCFKYNAAAMLGYRVIRIATGMANVDYLRKIIKEVAG